MSTSVPRAAGRPALAEVDVERPVAPRHAAHAVHRGGNAG